jgi:hypothetical protein
MQCLPEPIGLQHVRAGTPGRTPQERVSRPTHTHIRGAQPMPNLHLRDLCAVYPVAYSRSLLLLQGCSPMSVRFRAHVCQPSTSLQLRDRAGSSRPSARKDTSSSRQTLQETVPSMPHTQALRLADTCEYPKRHAYQASSAYTCGIRLARCSENSSSQHRHVQTVCIETTSVFLSFRYTILVSAYTPRDSGHKYIYPS